MWLSEFGPRDLALLPIARTRQWVRRRELRLRLSHWYGNGDVAKFEAAGVVALDVERSGLAFVGIERTAGDTVNFFVVDGQRAVTNNRYRSSDQGDVK